MSWKRILRISKIQQRSVSNRCLYASYAYTAEVIQTHKYTYIMQPEFSPHRWSKLKKKRSVNNKNHNSTRCSLYQVCILYIFWEKKTRQPHFHFGITTDVQRTAVSTVLIKTYKNEQTLNIRTIISIYSDITI